MMVKNGSGYVNSEGESCHCGKLHLPFAAAARSGAPQAIQTADRFHLVKNLAEAVQKALARCGAQIRKDLKAVETTVAVKPVEPLPSPVTSDGQPYSAHQKERYERYQQVMALRDEGIKLKEIAKRVGLGIRTVERWVAQGGYVETNGSPKHRSRYDTYAAYVQQRWDEGCHNIQQLWREIRAKGYTHSASALRRQLGTRQGKKKADLTPASAADHFEAATVVWLFIRPITDLDRSEQAELETLRQASETVEIIYLLVQEFLQMVRELGGKRLDAWIKTVLESGIPELNSFVCGILKDKEAVLAGLTLAYSNGPVEAQVGKLKLVKRSMFGRAKLPLLRQRLRNRI